MRSNRNLWIFSSILAQSIIRLILFIVVEPNSLLSSLRQTMSVKWWATFHISSDTLCRVLPVSHDNGFSQMYFSMHCVFCVFFVIFCLLWGSIFCWRIMQESWHVKFHGIRERRVQIIKCSLNVSPFYRPRYTSTFGLLSPSMWCQLSFSST